MVSCGSMHIHHQLLGKGSGRKKGVIHRLVSFSPANFYCGCSMEETTVELIQMWGVTERKQSENASKGKGRQIYNKRTRH